MKKNIKALLLAICALGLGMVSPAAQETKKGPNSNILIVIDGLRPDYVTDPLMPNLYALKKKGVYGDRHSAAFPTVTRLNSVSIGTGSYPRTHGILHNKMWLPQMGEEDFNTGNLEKLEQMGEVSGGNILTAPTVGKIMEDNGLFFFATGTAPSAGNPILMGLGSKGNRVWTTGGEDGVIVPQSERERALGAIGKIPATKPEKTVWGFDAYLYHATGDTPPDFTIMWINEPDGAGHEFGPGSPELKAALANVDRQIGKLVKTFKKHGLDNKVNIFVTSDHGASTDGGGFVLAQAIEEAGYTQAQVKVVNNMVYLREDDPALLGEIVEMLQYRPDVGAIYTRPFKEGASQGRVPGTLSTATVQWDHGRSADILVSPLWNDQVNEFGFAGASTQSPGKRSPGGHGSDSPHDVTIPLIAFGPDIKKGLLSRVPTGNVDFVPTALYLMGVEPPSGMDGRVMHELLVGGPDPEEVRVHEHLHQAATTLPDGLHYKVRLKSLQVGSTSYLQEAKAEREKGK